MQKVTFLGIIKIEVECLWQVEWIDIILQIQNKNKEQIKIRNYINQYMKKVIIQILKILYLYIEDNKVVIKTSNVRSIAFMPDVRGSKIRNAEYGSFIDGAEFELNEKVSWFRLVVTDNNGYKAYTNAYFVK